MDKFIKSLSNSFFSLTISGIAVYFGCKKAGVELPGFLYAGLVSLAGLIITSLVILSKKVRKDTKNKKAG